LEAADERKVCGPCLKRREGRSEVWATNADGSFTRTIWIDEVADNNGRFALVVGRFDLGGWLDGKLVSTMLVAPGIEKYASPARIRRCWDTTRQFWLDLVESHDGKPPELKEVITRRPFRLRINPANADKVNEALGDYHVYDWPLGGGITMSVVWVPDDEVGGHFLTADNLWYLVGPEQLDRVKREELGDNARVLTELGRLINRQEEVRLEEPSGYGRPAEARVIVERPEVKPVCEAYTPYIPILTEPATFMALVPADSALEVTKAIKNKYSTEMGRVHDRLPLHLGLVFAPRHTPLSAVLEAGRAMLNMPTTWEEWQIATIGHKATFSRNGRTFEWEYPAQMGDEQTQDIWYPHLLVVDPTVKPDLSLKAGSFRPVDNLTDTVYPIC
jgi:hypothetical protein